MSDLDLRDAFFEPLVEKAMSDNDYVFISDDFEVFSLKQFIETYPERYISPGVMEQHIINMAAGMASAGKRVVVCGIASFMTLRCLEQIKFNICSMGLPVTIVGVGAGLSFAFDGPTHHAIQDIAIMRAMPEMHILNPSDAASCAAAAAYVAKSQAPCYVRLDKGVHPTLYKTEQSLLDGVSTVLPQQRVNVISTGWATHWAKAHIQAHDLSLGLFDCYQLKPLPTDVLLPIAKASDKIVVVEENADTGNFKSMIVDMLSAANVHCEVSAVTLADGQYLEYGSRGWLAEQKGLRAELLSQAAIL